MGLFSFLFGSCSKPQAAAPPPLQKDAEAKADAEKLLNTLLPFAEQMLQQHRGFFPFGGRMAPDGVITHEGAYNGSEQPPSQELMTFCAKATSRTHAPRSSELAPRFTTFEPSHPVAPRSRTPLPPPWTTFPAIPWSSSIPIRSTLHRSCRSKHLLQSRLIKTSSGLFRNPHHEQQPRTRNA